MAADNKVSVILGECRQLEMLTNWMLTLIAYLNYNQALNGATRYGWMRVPSHSEQHKNRAEP